jgi:hypothetical protein
MFEAWLMSQSHRTLKAISHKRRLKLILYGMIDRCYNPKNSSYKWYGSLGITVCEEWKSSSDAFVTWALSNGWVLGLTIERKNVHGHYGPSNCEWIPRSKQPDNRGYTVRIIAFGETKTQTQWSKDERCRVSYQTLKLRIRRGWNHEDAIITPLQR